jgi:uncharacterized peroxidase-related enzyme
MSYVQPLSRKDLAELEDLLTPIEATMGFVPNSFLTMARRPEILRALVGLLRAVRGGTVRPQLKQLVAYIASTAAGCRYCQAHTSGTAIRMGVPVEKLETVWNFEQEGGFDAAERAALRLARDAALVPNAVTPAHFEELHKYFSDDEIVELVAMVSMFGFFNRWNDTMATELEPQPLAFASKNLAPRGWQAGKHATVS